MPEYNPCCFCLGGDSDIPPFGRLRDAQDFVNPCATCSLTTHRKCLLDWFSSLPSEKLKVLDALIVANNNNNSDAANDDDSHSAGNPAEMDLSSSDLGFGGRGGENGDDNFELFVSPQQLNRWLNGVTTGLGPNANFDPNSPLECQLVLLVAACPQCKKDITFSMKRSQLLTLNSGFRNLMIRSAQVGCVFTVVASAITGVLSMSYIGLTTCGLKIMDSIVPGPLLVNMLMKPASASSTSLTLLFDVNSFAIDSLETALSRGMIDPFKFSRIPIVPIVLYRMRSTSLISCLVGIKTATLSGSGSGSDSGSGSGDAVPSGRNADRQQYDIQLGSWLTELMVDSYISSLGNHKLVKLIWKNIINNRSAFAGVNFWNVNNMMAMLIPVRWLYDLFYRLTINRLHFNLAMKIRPRDIANSLPQQEFEKLEKLDSNLSTYECDLHYLRVLSDSEVEKASPSNSYLNQILKYFRKKAYYVQLCQRAGLPKTYLSTKLSAWLLETKACIENDYSGTFIYKSFTLRCLTTILWPFLSSKLGGIIFNTLLKKFTESHHIPANKLLLLSNLIGLVGVVFLKDVVNLYLCSKKAQQIGDMVVMGDFTGRSAKLRQSSNSDSNVNDAMDLELEPEAPEPYLLNFPGGYSMSIRLR